MNQGDDQNPYAPPSQFDQGRLSPIDDDEEMQFPAEPFDRFLARAVDGLLALAFLVPWMIFLIYTDTLTMADLQKNPLSRFMIMPATLPLYIYQWNLITRTGQTIGKKWMRIRVIKLDGSPLGFGDGVVLREWVMQGINFIPCVGPLISFVGYLMIFGGERRCLHDRIAGTRVIKTLAG
jgi:uncharacterized RDD family membrane protein YckC